jgi:hypothetical protein
LVVCKSLNPARMRKSILTTIYSRVFIYEIHKLVARYLTEIILTIRLSIA